MSPRYGVDCLLHRLRHDMLSLLHAQHASCRACSFHSNALPTIPELKLGCTSRHTPACSTCHTDICMYSVHLASVVFCTIFCFVGFESGAGQSQCSWFTSSITFQPHHEQSQHQHDCNSRLSVLACWGFHWGPDICADAFHQQHHKASGSNTGQFHWLCCGSVIVAGCCCCLWSWLAQTKASAEANSCMA